MRHARTVVREESGDDGETSRWWFRVDDARAFAYDHPNADDVVRDPTREDDESGRAVDPGRAKRTGNGGTLRSRIAICRLARERGIVGDDSGVGLRATRRPTRETCPRGQTTISCA